MVLHLPPASFSARKVIANRVALQHSMMCGVSCAIIGFRCRRLPQRAPQRSRRGGGGGGGRPAGGAAAPTSHPDAPAPPLPQPIEGVGEGGPPSGGAVETLGIGVITRPPKLEPEDARLPGGQANAGCGDGNGAADFRAESDSFTFSAWKSSQATEKCPPDLRRLRRLWPRQKPPGGFGILCPLLKLFNTAAPILVGSLGQGCAPGDSKASLTRPMPADGAVLGSRVVLVAVRAIAVAIVDGSPQRHFDAAPPSA